MNLFTYCLHDLTLVPFADDLNFPDDIILDVMLLAQKMVINRVLNHCMLHVRHNLSPRNVVNWLMWADEHNGFAELRSTSFSYLVGAMSMSRDRWGHDMLAYPQWP